MPSYEAVKKWRNVNKARIVEAFGSRCAACGLVDHPIAYDFHHLDPRVKDFQITSQIKNWLKIAEEAKKCCMLCVICHRKLHSGLICLPGDYPRFDESKIITAHYGVVKEPCPVCSKPKPLSMIVCSAVCADKKRRRVDWDNVDVREVLRKAGNYSAAGRMLGISGNAVKKRHQLVLGMVRLR